MLPGRWLKAVHAGKNDHAPVFNPDKFVDLFRFGHAVDGETPPVGEAEQWQKFFQEYGDWKKKKRLKDDEALTLGKHVRKEFAAAVRDTVRQDFQDNGRGYPAVALRLLSDICQGQRAIVDTLETLVQKSDHLEQLLGSVLSNAQSKSEQVIAAIDDEQLRDSLSPLARSISQLSETVASEFQQTRAHISAEHERTRSGGLPIQLPWQRDDENSRFTASARRVEMRGRRRDSAWIQSFLDDEPMFQWAAVVGHGGMGKTRLALEHCYKAPNEWAAGFITLETYGQLPKWAGDDGWKPERPTLIVFDYVAYGKHANTIHEAIHGLTLRRDELGHKVRVLVLERPEPGLPGYEQQEEQQDWGGPIERIRQGLPIGTLADGWWNRIVGTGNNAVDATCARRNSAGHALPYVLEGLDETAAAAVIHELLSKRGLQPDPAKLKEHMSAVHMVVPDYRPLYLAFAAEAIAEDKLSTNWKTADLMNYVLHRENIRWLQLFQDEAPDSLDRFRRLLVLATACDGLSLVEDNGTLLLEEIGDGELIPKPLRYDKGTRYGKLVPGATETLAPKLEPDPLGECLVLEELKAKHAPATRRLACLARRHRPVTHANFLRRAAKNQPEHPALDHLLDPEFCDAGGGERTPDREPFIADLADAVVTRLKYLGDLGSDLFDDVYARAMAADWLPPRAREAIATVAANRAGAVVDIETLLEDTERPDTEPLPEPVAVLRASRLGAVLATETIPEVQAKRIINELSRLAKQHPGSSFLRTSYARGLFNAHFASDRTSEHGDDLLSELGALANEHPDDEAVRKHLAGAVYNAHHGSDHASKRGEDFLDELRALANDHPDDEAVRERLAMAVVNAHVASDRTSERGEKLLTEIRDLASGYPDDETVRNQLAKAVYNASHDCDPASKRGEDLLGELRDLANNHPDDEAVRNQLAVAVYNAHHDCDPASKRGEDLLGELRDLANNHPGDKAVRERLAEAVYNAHHDCDRASEKGEKLLGELRDLVNNHPDDEAVRKQLAMAIVNAHRESDLASKRANDFFGELRDLARGYPDDEAVREQLAGASYSAHRHSVLVSEYSVKKLQLLRDLANNHPDDDEVRKYLARSIGITIAMIVANRHRVDRAVSLAEELARLPGGVESDPEDRSAYEQAVDGAIWLAAEQGNAEAGRRLEAMRDALFGDLPRD
ncbi:MAG: hypothetical protein Phyf2KO_27630 [Phycisphaerales bacterium]